VATTFLLNRERFIIQYTGLTAQKRYTVKAHTPAIFGGIVRLTREGKVVLALAGPLEREKWSVFVVWHWSKCASIMTIGKNENTYMKEPSLKFHIDPMWQHRRKGFLKGCKNSRFYDDDRNVTQNLCLEKICLKHLILYWSTSTRSLPRGEGNNPPGFKSKTLENKGSAHNENVDILHYHSLKDS